MLDDLKYIHERDVQDALGVTEKQWKQLEHKFPVSFRPKHDIHNVVFAGMGGSAIPAVFLQSWPGVNVPFEIVRNYHLPKYVSKNTLFVASSYSGNTEETLSALHDAEAKEANIIVMTTGGKLLEHAKSKNYPIFEIPAHLPPRMSVLNFLAACVRAFEQVGLIATGSHVLLHETAKWLEQQVSAWKPTAPASINLAKQIAQELMGKTVIVYSGPLMWPAANKWKININESSKNLAWANQYPEFNHNEFMGWTSHPVDKPFAVVEIRSNLEYERVQKRFEVSERLLSGKRPSPIVVEPQGDNLLEQLLWSTVLGDFVSIYLALLNGVNPTPVELVEKLKTALDT